jgi:NAD(P)-dependent dehydrogenase (short-subunit alcohol dehydrogenase family)
MSPTTTPTASPVTLPRFDLQGRVALVTGAARGLGAVFTAALAAAGGDVIAVDRRAIDPAALAALGAPAGRVHAFEADVTDEPALVRAVEAAVRRLGRLDVVVANAGVYPVAAFEDADPELWRRVLDVNVVGAAVTVRAALPHVRATGGGRVVLVSSGSVWFGPAGLSAYVTSKAALLGMARALAADLAEDGITVNALTPGLISTEGVREGPIAAYADQVVAG